MRTFLIFLFVVVVSLFVYNPELDDFKTHMVKSTQPSQFQQELTSLPDRMFNADTTTAEQQPTGYNTERDNFLFFSIYRITLTNDFQDEEVAKYLGIATMFFQIGESENMTAHAAQP